MDYPEYPKFLEEFAKENGLEIVDIVEDNHQEKISFFVIFRGRYGQETKRIDFEKGKIFES